MSREILDTVGLSRALILTAGQFLFKMAVDRSPAIGHFAHVRHLPGSPLL